MNANSSTTINNWLRHAQDKLKQSGVSSHNLDTLVMAEYIIGINRAAILARDNQLLTGSQLARLNSLLKRRAAREPLAYILGKKEFYGREFYVDKNVLVPRPESESFIELLKKHRITHQSIADVGSGAGILGITAKLELPTSQVTLIDTDQAALDVAKRNAKNLGATCSYLKDDLLTSSGHYDIIMTNLPYVPNNMTVERELSYEPYGALFSGEDGLDHYKRFWQQAKDSPAQLILVESLRQQHKTMVQLAKKAGFSLSETAGLVQSFTPSIAKRIT